MRSVWEQASFGQRPDVLVIGAGIVGLFSALFLKRARPDHHVVVLERGAYPGGASVKNAGFACFGSPSEILADMDAEGRDTALGRVEERWKGLLALRAELGDEAMGMRLCGGYELFHADSGLYTRVASRFDALNADLREIFGREAFSWQDDRIPTLGLRTDHLAFTDLEGAVDSGVLITALMAKVRAAGVVVLTGMAVTAMDEGPSGVAVVVAGQEGLHAQQVLVATNGYLRQLLPQADVFPARGQVLLTAPIPGLRLRGTFHAEEGYYYFRDLGDRILLGGGRHLDKAAESTWEDRTTPMIQEALEGLLRDRIAIGDVVTIERRWSGVMGFRGAGKTALLERRSPRIAVAAGLNGMGVAIGIRVAEKAAALLRE